VAAKHIAQVTEAARNLPARAERQIARVVPRRSGLRALRRAVVTFAVVVLAGASSSVGLAYAGVQLPSAVLTAFNDIGVHLPNQGDGQGSVQNGTPSTSSEHGQDVKTVATTGPHGCVHGRVVSGVASNGQQSSRADGHRQNADHQTADPCAQAHNQSGAGGQSSSASTGGQQNHGPSTTGTTNRETHGQGDSGSSSGATHGRSDPGGDKRSAQGKASSQEHFRSGESGGSKSNGR